METVVSTQPVKMSPIKMTPKLKVLLISVGVLFVITVIVLLLVPSRPKQPTVIAPTPLPSSEAISSPIDRPLSEVAGTDEFKNFESKLNTTRVEQDSLDTTESKLTFPLVETNVNYDK